MSVSCLGAKYEKLGSATDAPALALLAAKHPLAWPPAPHVSYGKSLKQILHFSFSNQMVILILIIPWWHEVRA